MNTKRRFLSAVLALTIIMSAFCIAPIHAVDNGENTTGKSTLSISVETYLRDSNSGEVISTYYTYHFKFTAPVFRNLEFFNRGELESVRAFIDGIIQDYYKFNLGVTIDDGGHSNEPVHTLLDIVFGCPGELSIKGMSCTEYEDGSLDLMLELKQVPDTFDITFLYGPDFDKNEPYSKVTRTFFAGDGFHDFILDLIADGYMYAGIFTDETFTVPATFVAEEGDSVYDYMAYDGLEVFIKCVPEYLYGTSFLTVSNRDPNVTDRELPRVTDVYAITDLPGSDFAAIGYITGASGLEELNASVEAAMEEQLETIPEEDRESARKEFEEMLEDADQRVEIMKFILMDSMMPTFDFQIPAKCYKSVVCEGVVEKYPRTEGDSIGVSRLDFSGAYSFTDPVNNEGMKYVSEIMFYTIPYYVTFDGVMVQMNPSVFIVNEGSKLLEPLNIGFGVNDYSYMSVEELREIAAMYD